MGSLVIPPPLVCFSCQRLSLFLTTIDSACPTPWRETTRGGRAALIICSSMQYFRYARLATRSSFAPLCHGYRTRTVSYIGCVKVFLPLSFLCFFASLSTTSASASLVSFRLPNRGHLFFFFSNLRLYFTIPPPILGDFAPRSSTFVLYPDRRRCRFALTASPSSRLDRFPPHFAK